MCKLDILRYFDGGQTAALMHAIGGKEAVERILRGEVKISLEDIIRKFFDKNGRGIPDNLTASVCDPNLNYKLSQSDVLSNGFLAAGFKRVEDYLSDYLGRGMISFPDFQEQVTALVDKLKADDSIANLLKGVWLPIIIPQITVEDYGETLENVFLAGVEGSYKEQYPKRAWQNWRKGELYGQVSVVGESRHDKLVSRIAEAPVVGIYFPNPMQGFSVHAQREFVQHLPESFLLAGGFDTATAMLMYPQVLAESNKTPGYDCAALQYKSPEQSLCFKADDVKLKFDYWGNLGHAYEGYSGGLSFLG